MTKYVDVDLSKDEKQAIIKYASYLISDKATNDDLLNKRKKWIRFCSGEQSDGVRPSIPHPEILFSK